MVAGYRVKKDDDKEWRRWVDEAWEVRGGAVQWCSAICREANSSCAAAESAPHSSACRVIRWTRLACSPAPTPVSQASDSNRRVTAHCDGLLPFNTSQGRESGSHDEFIFSFSLILSGCLSASRQPLNLYPSISPHRLHLIPLLRGRLTSVRCLSHKHFPSETWSSRLAHFWQQRRLEGFMTFHTKRDFAAHLVQVILARTFTFGHKNIYTYFWLEMDENLWWCSGEGKLLQYYLGQA